MSNVSRREAASDGGVPPDVDTDDDLDTDAPTPELDDSDSPFDVAEEQRHLDEKFPLQPTQQAPVLEDDDEDADDEDPDAGEDADDQGEDPDAGDDADDDDDQYSQRVQRRIAKEVRRRKQAETAVAQANQARQMAEQAAAQAQAAIQQMVGHTVDSTVEAMESEYATLNRDLREAIENGDTDKQVELNQQMIDLRSNINITKMRQPARPQADDPQGQQQQHMQQPQAQQPNPLGVQFAQRHAAWWGNPEHADIQAYALGVDVKLTQQGVPVNEAYYAKLEQEVVKRFPEVADMVDGLTPPTRKAKKPARRKSTPAAPAGRGNARRGNNAANSRGKVTLTKEDLQVMEDFGLDPSDPEHVKEFARNKLEPAPGA